MQLNQRKAGAVLSYVSLIINAAVAFVYVPLLLGFLTISEYGVYELIGSIIAYLSVMDMGLSTTLNRFYVRIKVRKNEDAVKNLLAMAAIIYGVITVLAVIVCLIMNNLLDPLYSASFSPDELILAHQMMGLVLLNCIVVLPGNWFLALINANERFVFARVISISKYLLQVVVVVLVLNWESSALLVLGVQVLMNLLAVIAYIIYVKRTLNIKAKFQYWDRPLFRSLLLFSFFILLNMVFDQVFWKTGQVILGAVSGSVAVAVYGIVCKLITSGYMQVSTGVTSVFLPKLTAISAKTDDMVEINELFNRIGRIQAILVWGLLAGFVSLGNEFIFLWAGPDFSEAYPAVVILMLGLSVSLIQNLGISVLQAKNKMGFRVGMYTILAILDVVISIPISSEYGIVGCATVAAVLLFIGTGPVINYYYYRVIHLDIASFFRSVMPLLLPAILTMILTIAFTQIMPLGYSWTSLILYIIFFLSVYFLLLWFIWANDYEKGLLKTVINRIGFNKKQQ